MSEKRQGLFLIEQLADGRLSVQDWTGLTTVCTSANLGVHCSEVLRTNDLPELEVVRSAIPDLAEHAAAALVPPQYQTLAKSGAAALAVWLRRRQQQQQQQRVEQERERQRQAANPPPPPSSRPSPPEDAAPSRANPQRRGRRVGS